MPIITYVNAVTSAENAAQFEEKLGQVASAAKHLKGCQKSEWYRNPDPTYHYTMYGEFDSEENFTLYKHSSVVDIIVKQLIPLTASKPEFKHFRAQVFEQG